MRVLKEFRALASKYARVRTDNTFPSMRQRLAWALGIATGLVVMSIVVTVQLATSTV